MNHQQHFFWYFGTTFFFDEIFIVSASFFTPSFFDFTSVTAFVDSAFDPFYDAPDWEEGRVLGLFPVWNQLMPSLSILVLAIPIPKSRMLS